MKCSADKGTKDKEDRGDREGGRQRGSNFEAQKKERKLPAPVIGCKAVGRVGGLK